MAELPDGFADAMAFSLVEALLGRRSRRFFAGAEIPDGPFAFKSRQPHQPLSELEKLLVVAACGAGTGWHNMIYRAARYAPHLSNYCGSGAGRVFPSAAGFETSKTFFTDDDGLYLLDNRDRPPPVQHDNQGHLDLPRLLEKLKSQIITIHPGRLRLPPQVPHVEPHNTWVANHPGTLLVIPVADLSQHLLLNLCYMLQNGLVMVDDVNRRTVPGIERYGHLFDPDRSWPLTFIEQVTLAETTTEMATACYGGALMLQAIGLGGWMFNGIDPFSILGASGDPAAPALGFRFDTDERWPTPNPTGLPGLMEGYCPPHYADMRAAVDALCERKFGPGGPYHPDTPGPWKDSRAVRSAAQPHDEEFRQCVALQAQYLYDTFGRFPPTVPAMFAFIYLQAHHLDTEFYDSFYQPGSYLPTHARHWQRWHGDNRP